MAITPERHYTIANIQKIMTDLNDLHEEIYAVTTYPERRAYDEALFALIELYDLLVDNK